MEQYGYCNFQQQGYYTASEDPYFHNPPANRQQALNELYNHISAADGDVSLIGIYTDLNSKDENPRYFFQCSGRLTLRNAAYAHGYLLQVGKDGEKALFNDSFLHLLNAPFMTGDEMERISPDVADRYFPTLTEANWQDVIRPARIPDPLLKAIVLRLLNKERVILRLNEEQAAAMGYSVADYARSVLLTIYAALPYAARRSCGFCTNTAAERFSMGTANPLPSMVKLCLVSPQEIIPDRADVQRDLLTFDGAFPDVAKEAARLRVNEGQLKKLLDILINVDTPEKVDRRKEFFETAYSACENGKMGQAVTLKDYLGVLPLGEMLTLELSADNIEYQANWYCDNLRNKGMVRSFLESSCKKQTPEVMADYLNGCWARYRIGEQGTLAALISGPAHGAQELPLRQVTGLFMGVLGFYVTDTLGITEQGAAAEKLAEEAGKLSGMICSAVLDTVNAEKTKYRVQDENTLPLATAKSVQYLKDYLRQVQGLRIPAADRDNLILKALCEGLVVELQYLINAEQKTYEQEVADETSRARQELASAQDCGALCNVYYALCHPGFRYPVCSDAVAQGSALKSAAAYGTETVEIIREKLTGWLQPDNWEERGRLADVLAQLKQEELGQYSEVADLVRNAEKAFGQLETAEKRLAECVSFADYLRMYSDITAGTGWSALSFKMQSSVKSILRPWLEQLCTLQNLLENTTEMATLYKYEDPLAKTLTGHYLEVNPNAMDAADAELLVTHSEQWCRLASYQQKASGKRPSLVLSDSEILSANGSDIIELLRWMQPEAEVTAGPIPSLIPQLCKAAPGWILQSFAEDGTRMDAIVSKYNELNSFNPDDPFYKLLLDRPVWEGIAPGQLAICLCRQSNRTHIQHLPMAQSWLRLMQMTQNQQTAVDRVESECDRFARLLNSSVENAQRCEQSRYRSLSKRYQKNASRTGVLLLVTVLASTLSASLLSLGQPSLCSLLFIVLAASVVLTAVLGMVLLPKVVWKGKRYHLFPATMAVIGYLPAIVILAVRVLVHVS